MKAVQQLTRTMINALWRKIENQSPDMKFIAGDVKKFVIPLKGRRYHSFKAHVQLRELIVISCVASSNDH